MKIGIVAFPLFRGKNTGRGLDRTFEEIASGFEKINAKFCYYDAGFIPNEWQAIFKSLKFFRALKKTRDDVYLAVYPVSAIFPILARKRPVVVGIHDMIPFHVFGYNNRLKYTFKRWAIKFAALNSDHIIVGLATTKKELIEYFKVPASKITIVPYGIDPGVYFLDNKIKKEPYKIAFLGEAKRAKGMDTAIKAFAIVRKKFSKAKLILASSGAEFEKMKRLAKSILPANSYEFIGFVPENKMRKFYASADVFVFPSRHGFGLSALEAMACGTPAIVGDTLDARDFFTDEDLLSDPNDPHMLAGKINNLFGNRNLYNQKCKEALLSVKGFTWDSTARGYLSRCKKIFELSNTRYREEKQDTTKKIAATLKPMIATYNFINRHLLGVALRALISICFLFYIANKINWYDVNQVLINVNLVIFFIALILNFLIEFFSIKRHQLILEYLGKKIDFWQLTKIYFFGLFAALFIPAGSDISKFINMKTKNNIRLRTGAISLVYDRLIGFLALVLLFSVAVILSEFLSLGLGKDWLVWASSLFLLLLTLITLIVVKNRREISAVFLRCLFLSSVYQIFIIFTVFLVGYAINPDTKFGWYFLVVPAINFGSMLPVSVGGLGVREWLLIFFASYLGLAREQALSISLILWLFLFIEGVFGVVVYYFERKKK